MSNDTANGHSPTVTVVPMTSKKKKAYLPTHVLLGAGDCPFLGPSMALAEQITTIGKVQAGIPQCRGRSHPGLPEGL